MDAGTEGVAPRDLTPYAHNARTHSDDQISCIAASMLEFGVNNPILMDNEGGIVAVLSFTSPPYGNQRDYTAGIDDWDSRGLMPWADSRGLIAVG